MGIPAPFISSGGELAVTPMTGLLLLLSLSLLLLLMLMLMTVRGVVRSKLLTLDLEPNAVDEHLVFLPLRFHVENIIAEFLDNLLLGHQLSLVLPHLLLLHENHACEGG